MDAHTPYGRYPKHLQAIRGDTSIEHVIKPHDEGKADQPHESVIDTYDACIRNVDEQVGRLLNQLPEDTMVVLTGDHGEEFGRYREFHTGSMYSSYTQVPIIIRDPELKKGKKKSPAQHLDLPPTILRRADIPIPDHWEGSPLQETNRNYDDPIYFAHHYTMAVRVGDWKYIDRRGEEPALYHTSHSGTDVDPVTEENAKKADKLRRLLYEHRSRPTIGKGRSDIRNGHSEITDTIEENLEDLGYL
jgi:arylsulfatase A-like enzyme